MPPFVLPQDSQSWMKGSGSPMATSDRSYLSHAKVISALTLLSRVFGMLRETFLARFFGMGTVASALALAFTVPNLFRKLFGEGALSAAFIPLYSKSLKEQSEAEAREFAASSVNLLTLILLGITVAGEIVILALIFFADPKRQAFILTLKLAAIMLPYVVLICLTAFLSAILQVHRRFAASAAAPILLNVIHICVTVVGGTLLAINATKDGQQLLQKQTLLAWWLAVFVLVAGLAQIAILLPSLRAIGFRFQWWGTFWSPQIRHMLKMSIPVAMAAGVLQISVLMDKGISAVLARDVDEAGHLIEQISVLGRNIQLPMELGAVKRLDVAQVLYLFPLGIFAIALATAIFPGLSSNALEKDRAKFNDTLRTSIEATLFEGIAASVGLIIVRYQAIRLFVKYGKVTDHDVDLIARSLMIYASAIWAYSIQQIVNRAYYALHDMRTPFLWSIANILLNLAVELPLVWTRLGESGMAAGTAASFGIQSIFMLIMLRGRVGDFGLRQIAAMVGKMLLAAGLMYGACAAVQMLPLFPQGTGKASTLLQLIVLMGVGAGVYLGVCRLLGIDMLRMLVPKKKPS
jgi:putative peptidoglycan lipid II flippase